eukprot:2576581-Pyramimonas_sp.AAC.1
MQLFAYAERKLSLAYGENYNNVSLPSNKATNVGDGSRKSNNSKKRTPDQNARNTNGNNKKTKPNTTAKSKNNGKAERTDYSECERCGRKHLGLCNAYKHRDGTALEDTPPAHAAKNKKK